MIVMGVAVFLYRDDKSGASEDTPHSWHLFNFLGLGELLVVRFHLITTCVYPMIASVSCSSFFPLLLMV